MKIYFLGDIGLFNDKTKTISKKINDSIKKNDIIIILGDNFYYNKNSNKDLGKEVKNLGFKNPIYAILGNHDYLVDINEQMNIKEWNMPNNYYKITTDKFDIFFIDTCILVPDYSNITTEIVKDKLGCDPKEKEEEMMLWLDYMLGCSRDKIKIICGHYPIISKGRYKWNKVLSDKLLPLISKHKVKYYVSGHDHNLQVLNIGLKGFIFKQIISGSSSCLYICDGDEKEGCFSEYGWIEIDNNEKITIKII